MTKLSSEDKADVAERVQRHRLLRRDAGLRPVQFWVTDTRKTGFPAECRRQCLAVREESKGRWIALQRGDLVTLEYARLGSANGLGSACGRRGTGFPCAPQRALVIQSRRFDAHSHVTVLPLTDQLRTAPLLRVTVNPDEGNTLSAKAQIVIDQVQSIRRNRIRMVFGHLSDSLLLAVDRALVIFLGIAR